MHKQSLSTLLRRVIVAFAFLSVSGYAAAGMSIEDPYGSKISDAKVERVIRISQTSRVVNVERFERVRFEFADSGHSFQWHFYTLGHPTIKLSQIAPELGNRYDVTIYVSPSPYEGG